MRLIDADALSKPIYAEDDNITGDGMTYSEMDGYNDGIDEAWRRIENAPTIDAVPVTHGEWIEDDYGYNRCSACGWEWDEPESVSPYCPHCGAKMEEGEIDA